MIHLTEQPDNDISNIHNLIDLMNPNKIKNKTLVKSIDETINLINLSEVSFVSSSNDFIGIESFELEATTKCKETSDKFINLLDQHLMKSFPTKNSGQLISTVNTTDFMNVLKELITDNTFINIEKYNETKSFRLHSIMLRSKYINTIEMYFSKIIDKICMNMLESMETQMKKFSLTAKLPQNLGTLKSMTNKEYSDSLHRLRKGKSDRISYS